MFVVAAILIWTGYGFLRVDPHGPKAQKQDSLTPQVLRFRTAVEVIAATGCILLWCHIVFALSGRFWPPEPVFTVLLVGPVMIGHIVVRMLVPGAFQFGVFPTELTERWSGSTRRLITCFLRVGWLGYIAILLAWPDINVRMPVPWGRNVEMISCFVISILYATQVVVLHFGDLRKPEIREHGT